MNNHDLEKLWEEYCFEIASYISKQMRRKRGQDVVDDLVSTVFVRAAVAMSNGNGYKVDARGWLYQIARSAIADYLRTLHYKIFVPIEEVIEEPDNEASTFETVRQEIRAQNLYRAIGSLVESQKRAMQLRLLGYSNSEIAREVGMSEMAVRQLNYRAFQTLREILHREAA